VLQCVAVCRSVLQCVAVCCSMLQCVAVCCSVSSLLCSSCNALQHTATHSSTQQRTAAHCNALQHTAAHCSTLQHTATHCHTMPHTATHCHTLPHTAVHCNTLQQQGQRAFLRHSLHDHGITDPTHCNALQHTATHCNTLQHTRSWHHGSSTHICTSHVGRYGTHTMAHLYDPRHLKLQRVAVRCSALQCVVVLLQWHTYHGTLVDTILFVSCCSVLQRVAACCCSGTHTMLQCVVAVAHIPCCRVLLQWHTYQVTRVDTILFVSICSVLHIAVCCSVLQYVAVCHSVVAVAHILWHMSIRSSSSHVAVCCSVLQCVVYVAVLLQ